MNSKSSSTGSLSNTGSGPSSDPWAAGSSQPSKGWPRSTGQKEDLETRIERLRVQRNEWIERMALQMGKHRTCQGAKCMGFVYEWYGPLNLALPGVGFVERPCKCRRGEMWGEQKAQEANNIEVRQVRSDILKASGLPIKGQFEQLTLDTYSRTPNGKTPWFEDFAGWYKKEWVNGPRKQGVVLMGSLGIGKTGIAVSMGRDVIDKLGVKVLYMNVVDFVDQIGRAWVTKDGSDYTLLDRMKNRELLILNDLGAGHGSAKDWDDKSPMHHLFNVLEYRNTFEYPYVITTNCLGPKALGAVVGERNLNRITDSCKLFMCTGANLRGKERAS